jgi:hypothetical protein
MSDPTNESAPYGDQIETQHDDVMKEIPGATSLASARLKFARKNLENYEQRMRAHAERCVAGR